MFNVQKLSYIKTKCNSSILTLTLGANIFMTRSKTPKINVVRANNAEQLTPQSQCSISGSPKVMFLFTSSKLQRLVLDENFLSSNDFMKKTVDDKTFLK